MRLIMAILLLAAALPTFARAAGNYSLDYTAYILDLTYKGNKGQVQQYDGRRAYGSVESAVAVYAQSDNSFLNMEASELNGPGEQGYFDLNAGQYVRLTGKFNNLTHRQPFLKYPVMINGRVVTIYDRNTDIARGMSPGSTNYTTPDMMFDREESEAKLVYTLPSNPDSQLVAGMWQESEKGNTFSRYAYGTNQAYTSDLNRQTRDILVGLNTAIGEGAISADYTDRNFVDSADTRMLTSSLTVTGAFFKPDRVPTFSNRMNLYDIRYRNNAEAAIPVTASLSGRTRESGHNGYVASAYAATVGASYEPVKHVYLTAKAYGRAAAVAENTSFTNDLGRVYGSALGPETGIDHANLAADLKARYEYSDHLSFRAGYKYENNYRQYAGAEGFPKYASYQDGVVIDSNTHSNRLAAQDTRHIVSAGLEAALPYDMELGMGYTKMMANHAVLESMPTVQDKGEASLTVPLPFKLHLMASAEYLSEKNEKSELSDASLHQNSYQTALQWAGTSKFSAGADYTYEQASYHGQGWFGLENNPTGTVQNINNLHVANFLYRYTNRIIGYHAKLKLPKGFSLTGRGSYTMSEGHVPVNLNTWRDALTNVVATDLGPSDTRIASGMITLKYVPSGNRNLSARLGFRRDQWVDKVLAENSGSVNLVDVGLTAKF